MFAGSHGCCDQQFCLLGTGDRFVAHPQESQRCIFRRPCFEFFMFVCVVVFLTHGNIWMCVCGPVNRPPLFALAPDPRSKQRTYFPRKNSKNQAKSPPLGPWDGSCFFVNSFCNSSRMTPETHSVTTRHENEPTYPHPTAGSRTVRQEYRQMPQLLLVASAP